MKFKKQTMVKWYDVKQLASTGVKTVISGVFGNFADKREIQAASSPKESFHDFSKLGGTDLDEIWVDYISDLGDGFNSTYTMAHLLAQEELDFNEYKTKRGQILIMGGDEVYPTPEIKEYNNRLKGPYNAAFPWVDGDRKRPRLFAIPGNHDWYDGLTNFTRLFCQERALGNWHTKQKRSYFAIKLPHNYWILGIDIQFDADIDSPQKDFFKKISKEEIGPGDKIILCSAEPTWVYKSWSYRSKSNDRVSYFIDQIIHGKNDNFYGREKNKAKLIAILSGDLHHYSRYHKTDGDKCSLITAGGGGAFTHPTHFLKDMASFKQGDDYHLAEKSENSNDKAIFPSKKQSFFLGFRTLTFPLYSRSIVMFLGCFHLLTTWFLLSNMENKKSLFKEFPRIDLLEFLNHISEYVFLSPSVILLNLILLGGIIGFTDTSTGKGKWNYIVGVIHGFIQLFNYYFLVWLFCYFNAVILNMELKEVFWVVFIFSFEMIFIGGFISAFIFGLYLFVSTIFVKNHPTEAFSVFRWTGYKNFLRIHISKNGVIVFPVGVKNVVKDWKGNSEEEKPKFKGSKINAELIEQPFEL